MEFLPTEAKAPEDADVLAPADRRRLRERALVEALERRERSGRAVTGLEDVLRAFNAGQLRRIVLREGFARMGRLCHWCHRPSLHEARCAACGKRTEAVLDVVDTLARLARLQGCRVARLRHEPLDDLRRICGDLR